MLPAGPAPKVPEFEKKENAENSGQSRIERLPDSIISTILNYNTSREQAALSTTSSKLRNAQAETSETTRNSLQQLIPPIRELTIQHQQNRAALLVGLNRVFLGSPDATLEEKALAVNILIKKHVEHPEALLKQVDDILSSESSNLEQKRAAIIKLVLEQVPNLTGLSQELGYVDISLISLARVFSRYAVPVLGADTIKRENLDAELYARLQKITDIYRQYNILNLENNSREQLQPDRSRLYTVKNLELTKKLLDLGDTSSAEQLRKKIFSDHEELPELFLNAYLKNNDFMKAAGLAIDLMKIEREQYVNLVIKKCLEAGEIQQAFVLANAAIAFKGISLIEDANLQQLFKKGFIEVIYQSPLTEERCLKALGLYLHQLTTNKDKEIERFINQMQKEDAFNKFDNFYKNLILLALEKMTKDKPESPAAQWVATQQKKLHG